MITYPHYLRGHELAGSSQLFHSWCGSLEAAQTGEHCITLQQDKKNISKVREIGTWSSKQVCALPETRSDTWEELQVLISQRIVTIPRGKDAASRGGGEALPDRTNNKLVFADENNLQQRHIDS